jgi:hypothetical protein
MQDFAPFTPELRKATRLLNRFEYTSFWGSYTPAYAPIEKHEVNFNCPTVKNIKMLI